MSGGTHPRADQHDDGPVDQALDRLAAELRGSGRMLRRALAEAEDHLHELVDAAVAEGWSRHEAELVAVTRFGDPVGLARRLRRSAGWWPRAGALRQLVGTVVLLAGFGLVAVGASGALAGALGGMFGEAFVSGDPPGVTYTPQRCAELHVLASQAVDCAQAAVVHHFDEIVFQRVDAGILGVLVVGVSWLVRRLTGRRGDPPAPPSRLPDGFVPVAGAALFGVGALASLGLGAAQLLAGLSDGVGELLATGTVSLVAFVGFAVPLLRTIRLHDPIPT